MPCTILERIVWSLPSWLWSLDSWKAVLSVKNKRREHNTSSHHLYKQSRNCTLVLWYLLMYSCLQPLVYKVHYLCGFRYQKIVWLFQSETVKLFFSLFSVISRLFCNLPVWKQRLADIPRQEKDIKFCTST